MEKLKLIILSGEFFYIWPKFKNINEDILIDANSIEGIFIIMKILKILKLFRM